MNWEAIGAVGEIIGAIAVVATLIYLSMQMRINSRQLRSQNLHAGTSQNQQTVALQTDPNVVAALEKSVNGEELNFSESCYLESYVFTALYSYQNNYIHHLEGLGVSDWENTRESVKVFLGIPWVKNWFEVYGRNHFEKRFSAEIDKMLQEELLVPTYLKDIKS